MSHHRDNVPPYPTETVIFVTHIEGDRECLKIWGQQDLHSVTSVERSIYPFVEQFKQGYGRPSKSNPPIVGTLCCGKFKNDGYYRAKILDVHPEGIVVHFIDYGNTEILPLKDIHLLSSIPGAELLQSYPAMAVDFILFKVLPINGVWESRIIETIKSILCYNECRALVSNVANNRCLMKLWYNNEDFSDLLVRRHLALPSNIQDTCRIKPYQQSEMLQAPMYQQQNEGNMNNFVSMPMMQNANVNQNTNMQGMYCKAPSPGMNQHKYVAPQMSPPIQEALVFKSRVLAVGSIHDVLVSCVEDGPQKFSVQIQSTTDILSHLMKEINNRPKKPLQEPPLPGSVCLGYTREDRVLCRAVVMCVMEHRCKLYYVDFGHTEVLPYTDIFQLPSEFINPKVLSIRFTLSGLKELNITQEMKDYFKELVSRKLLCLQVRPPEGPPLIQYGDLYDNGVNIKDILKKAFPVPATVPMMYSYPQLQRLSKDVQEIVNVSFVESCKKFFVQLDIGAKSLESIMIGLAQYAKTASAFNVAQLKVGLPCAALYESEWYRAQILNINGDKVKVVYVDYGNEETLSIMSLRTIHDDLVTKLPAQAIKCALNGYEVLSTDQEVTNHFERLTLEKRFYMKVVASQPNSLLVDLFEFETMRSVHPQLLNNLFCDKTAENSTSSQNGEIQHLTKTTNLQSEDKDKYNKRNNTDSWNRNQNAKFSQESKPKSWKEKQTVNGEWPPEKQYDNRRERTSHFQRDNLQNDRFSRDETGNRYGRSYNKYDKGEMDTPNRSGREGFRGDRNRFPMNESRFNRNNSNDKALSDKDSDTSSKSNDNRGKGGFNRNSRAEKRDNGVFNRVQTAKWNDRNDRFGYNRNGRVNGDHNMSRNNFQNKDHDTNISYDQVNTCESWDTNANTEVQRKVVADKGSQFASMSIALGIVKNCEIVFINGPSNFFIQLSPEYLELEPIMNSIAETYEEGGETMQAFEAKCDMCCVAQYEEDLKWYRAVIKSVEGNNATVKFIDYGNTESVDFAKIKVIREEFLKLPMQAVQCKLLGLADTGDKDAEYTTFTEKIEGKSLEVEFVTEQSEIYEVLLREVVDGVSNTNYINEEFCTGMDLKKAKEIALNKRIPNATAKVVHAAPDHAPINLKWEFALYEPESKHDVIITWFINPNKFYCQTLTEEFKKMMNEIQKSYVNREPIKHKLEVGSSVIAVFSEDRALYRAEVINNNTHKGYIVQYIDFGNCATVNQNNIYPVEKKFMQLPRLAAQCTLKDIVPIKNLSWSEVDNDALDNCFNGDKYECTFHNLNGDQYTISLSHNGQDVGDILVQKNLAAFTEKLQPTKTVASAEVASEAANVKVTAPNEVERVDISLLSGQTLRMKVSSVESITRFYVQLPSAAKCERIINEYMADKNAEVMPRLSSREMCLGAGCLVNANGTWRRAVMINCSRLIGSFDVKLIDTGAYDEILDDALALPGALAVMQKQALECSLQGVPSSSDADKQLKELIEGKEVLVFVTEINDSRLIVKLYDLNGNGIMNTSESDKVISTVCPMPLFSSTHKVSVSCAALLENHSVCVWMQLCSDYETETKLFTDLHQYYSNSGQRLKPEVDLLCVVKGADDRWYRAKIISFTETTAYVNYIDFGNTEEVALEFIMALEPQFYEPHQLAANATLSVALAGTETEQINILQTHLIGKELTAIFYNVHNDWIVELIEDGEKLSDRFRSLNLVREEEEVASQPLSQTQESPATEQFDVYVSHVDTPNQFWLQRANNNVALTEIQEKLQQEVSNFPAIDSIPEEGTWCVAIYSFDDNWYRAEVLDADEGITTVRFIDYGNTDVIDKPGQILQMPDTWKNIERYAFKCKLDVIPVGMEDWDQITCNRYGDLVMSVDTVQAVIIADTVPKRVDLFINGKSVSETLVEEKLAVIVSSEEAEFADEEIVDIELDPHSAFVCHINSPSEFWVQEEKSVADLEVMTDRFIVADMFPKIDFLTEGLLCVAKYPEDSQWYRARVLSHDDNSTQVIFIDYGNSSVSTEIRALPEDLADVPPLSRKCCLELPSHVKEWSEEACNKFSELAAEGATIFILDVLNEQETSTVKLTLDNQDVADILAGLCEQHSPVIEERLPPLGEENSPNVVVSHINSPDEFWIQAESSISELEVMSDRLRDAQSFLTLITFDVGTICAAVYPEDEYWYRAKILAQREEGIEVLFIDYGNSAITDELRMLPHDVVDIPILSKRCALEKPHHIAAWSEQVCDKFKELAAEGATMFQFETLDENDPMHVRLSLNGTNVVELLQIECEDIPQVEKAIEDETENIASTTEEQVEAVADETVFQEDHPNEEISDFGKELVEEQQKHIVSYEKIVKLNEVESKVVAPEHTLEVSEILEDVDTAHVTYLKELTSIATELSVDDIIENMVRDSIEDSDTQEINGASLLADNEPQSVVQNDVDEQQELVTQVQSISTNESSDLLDSNKEQLQYVTQDNANEQQKLVSQVQPVNVNESVDASPVEPATVIERIMSTTEDATEDTDTKEILSVTNETQSQDAVQLDTDQIEEQETQSEAQPNINEPSERQVLDTFADTKIWGLPKESINPVKEFQKQSPTEDESAHGNADKDNLQAILKSASRDLDVSLKSTGAVVMTPLPSVTKTDPIEQRRLSSRRRSEDKIVPGCISRGESPDPEAAAYSLTPKIEKPAASAINTLQPVADSAKEEDDEILTVSVENNIP